MADGEGKNRRTAVRATDRVMLAYKKTNPEKFAAVQEDFQEGISIYNQEGLSDLQMHIGAQSALDRLRSRDPDLADFLKYLDNKVSMIQRRVKGEKSILDALKMQKVNLSAAGVAFYSFEEFQLGDLLEVHLALLPTYTYMFFFVRITHCDREGEHQGRPIFRLGTEFALMMDEDREKIVQHNFKQQSLALRTRHQDDE